MKTIKYFTLTCLLSLFWAGAAYAQGDIISAADFMQLIKTDKNVVIVDAAKADEYTMAHVKDAVSVPYKSLNQDGSLGLLKPVDELAAIFGKAGVSEKMTIVVYDEGSQKYSSRMYWTLKYLGAPNVKILHRDMNDWRKVRVPITKMPTKITATTFTPNVNKAIDADMAEVKAGSAILIDARVHDEYSGDSDKSKGHIPGAINIPYKEVLTDTEAFKDKAAMEAFAAQYNLTPNKPIIIYCNTGIIAAVIYVALTNELGWTNVKVYEGAYKEWEDKGQKMETKAGVAPAKKEKEAASDGGC